MPRIDTVAKLAGSIGVPIQELFVGIVWNPPPDVQEGTFTASPGAPDEMP